MSKSRHYRQEFSADADLVFRKRIKLGGEMMGPGDPVTKEMKEVFGRHRLKVWWKGGFIELANFEAPMSAAARAAKEMAGPIRGVGNGWYEVDLPEGTKKVRGKEKAEELLAASQEEPGSITSDQESPETGGESLTSDQPSDAPEGSEEPASEAESDPEGEQGED